MNILCIGDIVGEPGRDVVAKVLPGLKEEFGIDFVIANGENAAGGSGIMPKQADEIFKMGVDAITLGDHVWDKPEINRYLDECPQIIRPANFPPGAPGRGWMILESKSKVKVAIISLLGRTFMRYNVDCPFRAMDQILKEITPITDIIILDMHAETTSEKVAMGHYVDGRVSAVFGTHTHIQTADEKVLPQGTAYITDLGMSGPYDSVIGQNKEKILKRFLSSMPVKFEVALNDAKLCGALISVDDKTGRASSIVRIQKG